MPEEDLSYAILKEINQKMDLMISLLKLSNQDSLNKIRRKMNEDKVASKILDFADGSLSYSRLVTIVSSELGMAEITVKKKISEMRESGILTYSKKGKETFYENSGII